MALRAINDFAALLKTDGLVKIYVGAQTPSSIPWVVPKALLCERWEFFRKALSPDFKEGQTGVIHFPYDSEEGWSVVLYHLFNGEIPNLSDDAALSEVDQYLLSLAHAYAIADKYQFTALQNKIIRTFCVNLKDAAPDPSCFVEIVGIAPGKSGLRKIVLEEIVVGVYQSRTLQWEKVEGLTKVDGAFVELLECIEDYNGGGGIYFPEHAYGDDIEAMERDYFVREKSEDPPPLKVRQKKGRAKKARRH